MKGMVMPGTLFEELGFSYIGPDGIRHTLTSEVVDSLREFWDRIERNLIVHKIKKTDSLTDYTVPVGPNTNTYKGIAALISQENQQQVVAHGARGERFWDERALRT